MEAIKEITKYFITKIGGIEREKERGTIFLLISLLIAFLSLEEIAKFFNTKIRICLDWTLEG